MRAMSSGKKRRYWLVGNGWVSCVTLLVCCWLVVGDTVHNVSTVVPRGNSGVKIGGPSRSRESSGVKIGGSDSKRNREGVKVGETSRTRDPSTVRTVVTSPPKLDSSSDTKSDNASGGNVLEGSRAVTVGYPGGSPTVSAPAATTKLHIGLVVPSKSFGVREYTRAFSAAITGLQTRTRGRKLKLFNKYDINPRYDMKPLTPSPTGRNGSDIL